VNGTYDLKRWLSMLRRTAEADPVAGDVLSYQGNNQAQWLDPATLAGVLDHGGLLGLPDDDHTGYALLAGRAGGQVLYGGVAAGETLDLIGTSHATPGNVRIGENVQLLVEVGAGANTLVVDANSRVGIGTAAPGEDLHILSAANVRLKVETTNTNGTAHLILVNDAQSWITQCSTGDRYVIRDNTGGANVLSILPGAGANRLVIDASGHIGLGTASPAASALLELSSTTAALLLSRMTTGQRNALTAVNGMIIYNSTTGAFNFREAGAWVTGSGLV
jgi:hypothetical protein